MPDNVFDKIELGGFHVHWDNAAQMYNIRLAEGGRYAISQEGADDVEVVPVGTLAELREDLKTAQTRIADLEAQIQDPPSNSVSATDG